MASAAEKVWSGMILHEFENSAEFTKWSTYFSNLIFNKPYDFLTASEQNSVKALVHATLTSLGGKLGTNSTVKSMNTLYSSLVGASNGLSVLSLASGSNQLGINTVVGHSPYSMGAAAHLNKLIDSTLAENRAYGQSVVNKDLFSQFIGEAIRTNNFDLGASAFANVKVSTNAKEALTQLERAANSDYYVSQDSMKDVAIDALMRAMMKAKNIDTSKPLNEEATKKVEEELKALRENKGTLSEYLQTRYGKSLNNEDLNAVKELVGKAGITGQEDSYLYVNSINSIIDGKQKSILLSGKEITEKIKKAIKGSADVLNELADIFKTDDFNVLKEAAANLGITNLSSERGIKSMKDYLKYNRINSLRNGLTIEESLTQLGSIAPAVTKVFGENYSGNPFIVAQSNLAGEIAEANGKNKEQAIADTIAMHANNENFEVGTFAQLKFLATSDVANEEDKRKAKELVDMSARIRTPREAKKYQEILRSDDVQEFLNKYSLEKGGEQWQANLNNLGNADRARLTTILKSNDIENLAPTIKTLSNTFSKAFKTVSEKSINSFLASSLSLFGYDYNSLRAAVSKLDVARQRGITNTEDLVEQAFGSSLRNNREAKRFVETYSLLNEDQRELVYNAGVDSVKRSGLAGSLNIGIVKDNEQKILSYKEWATRHEKDSVANQKLSSVIMHKNISNKENVTGIELSGDTSKITDVNLARKSGFSLIAVDENGELTKEGSAEWVKLVDKSIKVKKENKKELESRVSSLNEQLKSAKTDAEKDEINTRIIQLKSRIKTLDEEIAELDKNKIISNIADVEANNILMATDDKTGKQMAVIMPEDVLKEEATQAAIAKYKDSGTYDSMLNRFLATTSKGGGALLEEFDKSVLQQEYLSVLDSTEKEGEINNFKNKYKDNKKAQAAFNEVDTEIDKGVKKGGDRKTIIAAKKEDVGTQIKELANDLDGLESLGTTAKKNHLKVVYDVQSQTASLQDKAGNVVASVNPKDTVGSLITAFQTAKDEATKSMIKEVIHNYGDEAVARFNNVERFQADGRGGGALDAVAQMDNVELTSDQAENMGVYVENEEGSNFKEKTGVAVTSDELEANFHTKDKKDFNAQVLKTIATNAEVRAKVANGESFMVGKKRVYVDKEKLKSVLPEIAHPELQKNIEPAYTNFLSSYNSAKDYANSNANNAPYMRPLSAILDALASLVSCIDSKMRIKVTND